MENKQAIAHALLKAEFIFLPFKTIIVLSEASEAWPAAVWSIAKVISIEERICDAPHRQQSRRPHLSRIDIESAMCEVFFVSTKKPPALKEFQRVALVRPSHRAVRVSRIYEVGKLRSAATSTGHQTLALTSS
jgi:hypothetical protein